MNAEIRGFEVTIRRFVEEAAVPAEVKYLVLKLLASEAKEAADAAVIAECSRKDEAKKEGQEDAESV